MAEQQDVVVEIEKEPPPEGVSPPADPVADLKAQYDELQEQKKREADGRAAAEQRANAEAARRAQAEHEAQTARGEVADTQLRSVTDGIEAAKVAAAAAKNEHKMALEQGDWAKATEAQEKIADARYDLKRFTEAKAQLEADRGEPRGRVAQQQQPAGDPVEAMIAKSEPNTARWLREHPDDARALAIAGNNPRRAAKLLAASNDAVSEGFELGSPEYFAHVERFLGMSKQEEKAETKKDTTPAGPAAPTRRPSSAPVAPVQSSGGGVSGGGGDVVKLTPGEARSATDGTLVWNYNDPSGNNRFKKGDPIGIQEMARRKKAMKEQGLYDKVFVEQ